MKRFLTVNVAARFGVALLFTFTANAADSLSEQLQRGLFEEEANHNLEAAIKTYQSVVSQSDEQRRLIATAVFRLGECYRKLGKTNEAHAYYQRVLRDFSDQEHLVALSRHWLPTARASARFGQEEADPAALALLREEIGLVEQQVKTAETLRLMGRAALDEAAQPKKELLRLQRLLPENASASRQKALIEEQIGIVRQILGANEKLAGDRLAPLGDTIPIKRELLSLQRELALLNAPQASDGASPAAMNAEASELFRVLERRRAELQSELITKRAQWEQLSRLSRQDLLKAAPQAFNDAILAGLQQEENRALQSLAGITNRFSAENLEVRVRAAAATIKTIRQQIDDRLDALLSGLRAQVEALSAQVGAVESELAKSSERSLKVPGGFSASSNEEEVELERLQLTVKDSPDLINAKDNNKNTPLHRAAMSGHLAVARFLLANRAEANAKNSSQETPLHIAAATGHKSMVEFLIENGADVKSAGLGGDTPLHVAAGKGFRSVVEVLLARHADVNALGNNNHTPLHHAVRNGFRAVAEVLLAKGADVNMKNSSEATPLILAAETSNAGLIELLLQNKATPDAARRPDGRTALSVAAERGAMPVVSLLLTNGANPNQRDASGTTPLSWASQHRAPAVVEALLAAKADPNIADRNGVAPLHWAAIYGDATIAELLLKSKASTSAKVSVVPGQRAVTRGNAQIQNRASPLYFAVSGGHVAVVEALLRHGAEVNAVEKWDNGFTLTALHAAAGAGRTEIVKLLLENGADPNVRNGYGWTPLMLAASIRSREITELLLAHQAAVNVLGKDRQTALSLASEVWQNRPFSPEIAHLLREHGAIEDLQRSSSITIARGASRVTVFDQDVNGLNRFTLFEAVAQHYNDSRGPFAFPDFSRVKLIRLTSRTAPKEEVVDLDTAFKLGECGRDMWLEWGDLIEIPEQDHRVNDRWVGLPLPARDTLRKCLDKQVKIIVKNQTNLVALKWAFPDRPPPPPPLFLAGSTASSNSVIQLFHYRLNDIVRAANVIRSSSDLTRVKVRRTDSISGEKREMTFNLSEVDRPNDLWLRDGDEIEIPEKE